MRMGPDLRMLVVLGSMLRLLTNRSHDSWKGSYKPARALAVPSTEAAVGGKVGGLFTCNFGSRFHDTCLS
jgi:hypothetical protein